MSISKIEIKWISAGRKAEHPPNPKFPEGVDLDLTRGQPVFCPVPIQYPAPEVGAWLLKCHTCGFSATVTAAGRVDDPRFVRIPCKPGHPAGHA